ncbi:MAG: AEC family transporter [Verrucomicrobiota bacterium]|nr:AEC family transporter [Verrucomicrobiota bacterium]
MNNIFFPTFILIFKAVIQITLVAIAGGILVRKKIITPKQVKFLASVTIKIFLPCLIFSKLVTYFDPGAFKIWWLIPVSAVLIIFAGLLLGALFFIRELPEKKNMLSLSGIHNASYLILPIGAFVYKDNFGQFSLYVFLFTIAMSPILWSIGKELSTERNEKLSLKKLLTPPLYANFFGLLVVFTHTKWLIPEPVMGAIDLIGGAAIPVATLVLGATLGSISFKKWAPTKDILRVVIVKLVFVPIITIFVLNATGLHLTYPFLAEFLVLEAASAPATGTILQIRNYGGDTQKVGSIMIVCYLLCILTIPFWIAVWRAIITLS